MTVRVDADPIRLRGVRVHNLRNIDLDLPRDRLIVLTGLSGSGKSSLAFDTLHAEGRRRYIETFSPHLRQFLGTVEKPDADVIEGLPATIAISQRELRRSSRNTVGTITEIHDLLAVLYGKLGQVRCLDCGTWVEPADPAHVVAHVEKLSAGTRYLIAFPVDLLPGTPLDLLMARIREDGFRRVRVDDRIIHLDAEPIPAHPPAGLDVIVDRLVRGSEDQPRLLESIETAFARGLGRSKLLIAGDPWEDRTFQRGWRCPRCARAYLAPEPRLFRYHSPLGACPTCEGQGQILMGEVAPPIRADSRMGSRAAAISPGRFERSCPDCAGARLRRESLAVRIGDLNVAELSALSIDRAAAWLDRQDLENAIGQRLVGPIRERLELLKRLGLDYLTLDRPARTLSSGEARRVRLIAALGSGLVNTLYVLDEPSLGLHPSDVGRLVEVLKSLRDAGNTVAVVEHDRAILSAADWVVDIGPGAGAAGGRVVYSGPVSGLTQCAESATGAFLSRRKSPAKRTTRREISSQVVKLIGACGHNLKGISVSIPLRTLCAVTGVSGSGKSTLVLGTLFPAVAERLNARPRRPLPHRDVTIPGDLDAVIAVDDRPIGRTPRSNPVTFLKAFDEIRRTFAATYEARARNYHAGTFSFNMPGGRCEACEGGGYRLIDMQFLSDVMVRCPECHGSRYRPEVLEVTYRGKTIAETLDLTVREAFGHFRNRPRVQARLRPLIDVGLDYIRLGQPANTLSGGEAQRLKIAAFLGSSAAAMTRKASRTRTLFILDEPTRGLHPADVLVLIETLNRLVDIGNSVVVIEQTPEVMAAADWIIDLGPGAGDRGGEVVAQGTPEEVSRSGTATGSVLAEYLQRIGANT